MDEVVSITIGRSKENDIVIPDDTVSRKHAIAEVHYYDDILLIDQESRNGTFQNDNRIKRVKISARDKIRFGDNTVNNTSFFDDLFRIYKDRKSNFHREYNFMLEHFNVFQQKLDKLQEAPKRPLFIKLGLILIFIVLFVLFYDQIDHKYLYPMIIGMSALTIISGLVSVSRGKRNREIAKLKVSYERVLRCPKCKTSFLNMHLIMVEDLCHCPNNQCNAKFNPEN
ncbi:MAG: FHA domain-containing protein [Chitinophagaceae bacterium]|nr:MAG: FHA domain-containing protein [Chitinophagaceae bacterium]